jgi:hypothetical protein
MRRYKETGRYKETRRCEEMRRRQEMRCVGGNPPGLNNPSGALSGERAAGRREPPGAGDGADDRFATRRFAVVNTSRSSTCGCLIWYLAWTTENVIYMAGRRHLRAQRRQHGKLERPPQIQRAAILASLMILRRRRTTKQKPNQHHVSCSMEDRMEVQDSAQRVASPRSQQTASSTGDSLQLSMRSAMRTVSNLLNNVRSLAFHHAYGRMCLSSIGPV